MELKVEQMSEKNMYRLIVEASAEEFETGVAKAYEKNKGRLSIPGFRKGKAPRKMIEKMYGKTFFYNDAVDQIVPVLYEKAAVESGLDIVSKPTLKVVKMDEEKPLVFTAEVAVKPEVKLGDYKGVEVEKQDTLVTDEEVDAELDKIRNTNARVVDVTGRPVQDKDITTIDFVGSIDGVPFEGGTGRDYPLTIGSHTFIDTFEDQLIGMNIGDEKDVKVKFPDEYHASALKGKDAVFKVTVKEIKVRELPELDDEFAQDVSEFDTTKAYKDSIKKKLEDNKTSQAKNLREREVLERIIEGSEIDIPEPMIESQVSRMADDIQRSISQQGMKFEDYIQYMGLTVDKFLEDLKPEAIKRIQQRLVLEAIAKAEKFEISEEELAEEIKKTAEGYQMEAEEFEKMLGEEGKKQMREDAGIRKALELVNDSAKETVKKKPAAKKTTAKSESGEEAPKNTAKKTTKAADGETTKKPAAKKTTAKSEGGEEAPKKTTKKTTTKKAAAKDAE
ncbi:MAG: trigger factor [Clostridiales bacterium]|nr:trigger factor [Clostridiales bacterium]